MKKILLALIAPFVIHQAAFSQCQLRTTANLDTVVCGDAVILNVFGRGQGAVVFQENFNSGAPSGWAFTQQATFTNPCSPSGVDGTPHIWMGSQSASPRSLETNPYNFSAAISGATICFDLLLAAQGNGNPPPCEGPDRPDEGIYLQYKIGNGPWVTIHYFDPSGAGGNDPALISWNNWCFQLPQAALVPNVSIRWFQTIDSGADFDHWGIDNVQIFFNDPTYTISVKNPQGQGVYTFPQGSSGGDLPSVAPRVTTTYAFEMRNSNGDVCYDSFTVFVKDPFFEITAGRDTTVCAGKCAVLSSSAKVVKTYEKTVTFANTQLTQIATGIAGAATAIDVTVGGMNNTTLQNNMIQSVCIANLGFFGFNLFPPSQQTIGDLRIRLLCPDGTAIVLVPTGVTTSTTPLTGYTNTCFAIGSTTNIGTGTPPYSGSYQPNQPFNNLSGCSTNGVWKMEISTANAASFGQGTFLGWSITLKDPEVSYNGNFNWSPTTDMTNPTSPTPTICPTATRDYVLAVSDSANCKTVRDTVKVTVQQNCCNFTISTTATQPSCGASNGAITVTPTPVGTYTYLWNDNNALSARTGLAAGTYRVTVTDVANGGCTKDTIIILNSNSSLSLQLTNPVNPGCGTANGSVTVGLSGGTAPYVVGITLTGGPTQTINVPIAISQAVSNLAAGTYTIVVTDAQQCQQTQTVTLTLPNAPTITSVTSTTETCLGDNTATATVNATGGTGTLAYAWSNQQQTPTATGLAPNTYTVTVTDANSCTATGSVTVVAGPVCCVLNLTAAVTQPTCGATDGSITVTASPQAAYTYAWSAGGSTTATNSNLGVGTYRVTVTNTSNNCLKDTSFTLTNPNGPTVDSFKIKTVSCTATNDGAVTVYASSPNGVNVTAGFDWSNDNDSTDTQSDLAVGTYFFTVTDLVGCQTTGSVQIGKDPSCCSFQVSATPTAAGCTTNDGSIQVAVTTQGTTPYEYSIDGTTYQQGTSFSSIAAGSYSIYARDANGCGDTVTVTVTSPANNITLTLIPTNPNCTNANSGSVVANVTGGNGSISFNWNFIGSSNTISNLAAGTYNVTVTDDVGCTKTDSATLIANQPVVLDLGIDRNFCVGGNTTLNAPTGFTSYVWSTGETTESIIVDATSNYSVTVTNASGCTGSDAVVLTVFDNPVVTLPADTSIYDNNKILFAPAVDGSKVNATYLWQPETSLTCNDCEKPVASPDDTITYLLVFTDANGCVDSASTTINIIKGAKIFMPNVFSPNGDNKNDILLPKSIGVKSISWKVFNRWGELVFVTNDLNVGWDATFKGDAQPSGVYIYTMSVTFKNNTSNSYNGSVTLIR